MKWGPSSSYLRPSDAEAVRKPAFRPITMPMNTPGRARLSRLYPMNAWATYRAAEPNPGVWSLMTRSLSTVLGMDAAHVVAGAFCVAVDDAHRVGAVVAADVEEVAHVVRLADLEDFPAVGIVGLVARGQI